MLHSTEITEKSTWNNFLKKEEIQVYPFFQAWNWGEVQTALGFSVTRYGLWDDTQEPTLVGVCQVVTIKARRGQYVHLRHGPVLLSYTEKYLDFFLAFIEKEAKKQGAAFLRMSPLVGEEALPRGYLQKKKFINAPIHRLDAEICWVLDITKSEQQLLQEMKKNHRYGIKKAQTMGVEIIRTNTASDIESFLDLYKQLSTRKKFIPHKGLREEFAILGKDNEAVLYLAKWENKIIAGNLIVFMPSMAIYHHAAQDPAYRNVPASYLLQWEAIRDAQKRGIQLYNFWGIAPLGSKTHPWSGFTHFKTGFGGYVQEFMHAKDKPFGPLYWKTHIIEYITKLRKGY